MTDIDIKKVVKRIYNFDFSKCELEDGNEIISTNKGNEFVNTFIKRDLDNGILVTPSGYTKGLVYKSTNDGEIYNNPRWTPDIITFAFNIFGLKRGAFYRISVIGRNVHEYNRIIDITDDRTLEVSDDDQQLLINEDLNAVFENKTFSGVFRATSNEANLFFRIGKIYISDIIIDEIELMSETEEQEESTLVSFEEGKSTICAYGIFNTIPALDKPDYKGKYIEMTKLAGKGINLYYDKVSKEYILERDNVEDTLNAPLTNIEFIVDFNFNKVVSFGHFSDYRITEISPEISPNTLKQGYIKFVFVDKNENIVDYTKNEGRLCFIVKKIL